MKTNHYEVLGHHHSLGSLIEMMKSHYDEAHCVSGIPWDEDRMRQSVEEAIDASNQIILVIYRYGEMCGYSWLCNAQALYGCSSILHEVYTYITPEYRNGFVLAALIDELKIIANNCSASAIHVGSLGGADRNERAYSKRFTKLGSMYSIPAEE